MVEENTTKQPQPITPPIQGAPSTTPPAKGSFWKGFLVGGIVGGIITPILLAFLLLMICLS